jgi:hypothetical protein
MKIVTTFDDHAHFSRAQPISSSAVPAATGKNPSPLNGCERRLALKLPSLFMERVEAYAPWTPFSPDKTPDLHELIGGCALRTGARREPLAALWAESRRTI